MFILGRRYPTMNMRHTVEIVDVDFNGQSGLLLGRHPMRGVGRDVYRVYDQEGRLMISGKVAVEENGCNLQQPQYEGDMDHMEWQTMETAPKDGTHILCWVDPKAYPYVLETGKLTTYAAHAEWLDQAKKGFHICEWGGGVTGSKGDNIPDWWFVNGSDFEVVASPVRWMPLPEPPDQTE